MMDERYLNEACAHFKKLLEAQYERALRLNEAQEAVDYSKKETILLMIICIKQVEK